jgi:hypothetical protein
MLGSALQRGRMLVGRCEGALRGRRERELRRRLAPDARVHLELNAAPDGELFSPELRSTLLSLGARIRNHVVCFDRAARLPRA